MSLQLCHRVAEAGWRLFPISVNLRYPTLLLAILLAAPLMAQTWVGGARATGVVTDLDDVPISGAVVSLELEDTPGPGPRPTTTDSEGRWTVPNLAVGRWRISVKAKGFRTSHGWIDLPSGGAGPGVTVALRPLSEVTPAFASSAQSADNWIEMGNDLLEQHHPERARAEYEKALTVLPRESWPEVLRAVARTHYLEASHEATMTALEQALGIEPADEIGRELYLAVASQAGKLVEAEAFLADLSAGQSPGDRVVEVATVEDPLAADARMDQLPVEAPVAGRTGRYRVGFTEAAPSGGLAQLLSRLGVDQTYVGRHDPQGGRYELREESFQVFVPANPPPESGYGLLVWISPLPFGGFGREAVRDVLEEKGVIWIGADRSGNRRLLWYRVLLALDAVHNLAQYYPIDPTRVYAAGYSGGGRIASLLAQLYPEIFRGGFSLFGVDYWRPVAIPHMPGAHWPASYPAPAKEVMRRVKLQSRFVLLTGELDFNRSQTTAVYKQMVRDGFDAVDLIVIPGASHYHSVENRWLGRGVDFLDGSDDGRPLRPAAGTGDPG